MARYFIDLMYEGTLYKGWQVQPKQPTVQGTIEACLGQLFQKPVAVTGSGRTDTGVHAVQQVAHIDLMQEVTPDQLCHKLNTMLPPDIAVRQIYRVPDDTHARFSATQRAYIYQISPSKNAFRHAYAWQMSRSLDLDNMNEAAKYLLGTRDFKSFSKVKTEVNHFECTIFKAQWERKNDLIAFNVSANRFLRGMVRALVGTLTEVGLGKMSPQAFEEIIIAQNRKAAGVNAPPQGLFLTQVYYPPELLQYSEHL